MQLQVLFVTVAAALLQSGHGSFVSIRMPYLNPAGVTYINNVQPEAHVAYGVPADVEAQHIGYAAAQVPAVAAVPYVKHVPTVSHVPVTKFEAQPAIVEKQLDVVKPAVSTRKFEVRRPAIQKQFFDIEERVVVRPAGSAVVELDQPTSKTQKGPAVIQPFYHHFEASPVAPTLPSPAISASPATSSDDENVVVENPDFRKVGPQVQTGASPAQTRNSFNGAQASEEPFVAHDPSPNVLVSPQSSPEEDKQNQNRLIELLTARGNVAEVGFGRFGVSQSSVGDSGQVRGRVISATPAPDSAEPADERVSTRRVVLSRPIETLQEVNVVEPATKIERVSVHQPTFIKTARLDHVQVHGSVPVVGKALAPTIAHAAVPVYQKTNLPVYQYYH
ncbi:uncharacterized protein LOC108631569 [Ceratina calcarata]|uniref:Uncharacterized protein LOC108631569 n=1 Tax=Ceratina calcarata TaxID=156304 RepID=A0AAJ7NED3_9HYME|nr:uncharacterized protein LOC108631569 [Ceratina calcarata]XP_017891053.1 uncharacterized protein LOC108631569 [Ceratina calcarata]